MTKAKPLAKNAEREFQGDVMAVVFKQEFTADCHPAFFRQQIEQDPRPWKLHRNRRGWPTWYQRWLEAWWIITGKWSLHRAWQCGVNHGTAMEYKRTVVMGGK